MHVISKRTIRSVSYVINVIEKTQSESRIFRILSRAEPDGTLIKATDLARGNLDTTDRSHGLSPFILSNNPNGWGIYGPMRIRFHHLSPQACGNPGTSMVSPTRLLGMDLGEAHCKIFGRRKGRSTTHKGPHTFRVIFKC